MIFEQPPTVALIQHTHATSLYLSLPPSLFLPPSLPPSRSLALSRSLSADDVKDLAWVVTDVFMNEVCSRVFA